MLGMVARPIIRPVLIPRETMKVGRGYVPIPFQFPPTDGLTENVEMSYAEASSLGRLNPIIQFTKGSSKELTFEAMLYSETVTDLIEPLLFLLKRSAEPDPDLGRPPIWIFSWGLAVIETSVIVKSVTNIKTVKLRTDGLAKQVSLTVTLKRYEPFSLNQTDPDARPTQTRYYHVKSGDLWETIASQLYNNALLGDLLRRLYPDSPDPVTGSIIACPDPDTVRRVSVIPQSIPLARTSDGISLRNTTFKLRALSKVSTIIGA